MNETDFAKALSRRAFLHRSAQGLGAAALASLSGGATSALGAEGQWRGVLKQRHRPARTRAVIHLCMAGGPSHLETFDYKPALAKLHGQAMPESYTQGKPIAQLQGKELKVLGPQHPFRRHGQSGLYVSDALPHMAGIADEMCVLKSVFTEQINHDPAHTFFNAGTILPGRPSMGAWMNYAIGSEAEDLPGYVVMTSVGGGPGQPIASRQWGAGFLPSRFQGVKFNSSGDPVYYVKSPKGVTYEQQMTVYNAVNQINELTNERLQDPEIDTRIVQYEMAAKMQLSVPALTDVSQEPKHIFDMYGAMPGDGSFASNCMLARRLVERGTRFVQLYHLGWDHHDGVKKGVLDAAQYTDQACAALINDLKQRGLLDDVLIIWGGEFGRTPMAQGSGRDHHIQGYSMWMAGGGLRGGVSYGETDELGYNAVENPIHVNRIHSTMLDLLGIEHERLTYKFQGLDARLTGVSAAPPLRNLYA